jgi:hypothetical protein
MGMATPWGRQRLDAASRRREVVALREPVTVIDDGLHGMNFVAALSQEVGSYLGSSVLEPARTTHPPPRVRWLPFLNNGEGWAVFSARPSRVLVSLVKVSACPARLPWPRAPLAAGCARRGRDQLYVLGLTAPAH